MRVASILLIFASLASRASASFDLMFLQASVFEPNDITYKVHRYDPISNVSLGSFSIGTQAVGMAANASKGELYTIDINGYLRTFNYSTGERTSIVRVAVSLITDLALNPVNGKLFIANGTSTVYSVDPQTGATTSVLSRPGSIYTKLAVSRNNNGNIIAMNSSAGTLDRFLGGPTSYTYSNSVAANAGTATQMCFGTSGPTTTGNFVYAQGATSGFHFLVGVDNPGSAFSQGYFSTSDYRGCASAHDGFYMVGNDTITGGNTRINMIDSGGSYTLTRSIAGIAGGVRNIAVALAPEPSAFLPLLGGVLLMLRRKKVS